MLSFRLFLLTTFVVFCIPKIVTNSFWSNVLVPYAYPLLQTSLTISVYITALIAICAWLYIVHTPEQKSVGTKSTAQNEDETSQVDEGMSL